MSRKNLTYIPGLVPPPKFVPIDADDPYISPEVLKECSSMCATHESGLPNYILSDPYIPIDGYFTDDVLDRVEKIQLQRESKDREAELLEKKKKEESEAADRQLRKPLDQQVERVFKKKQHFVKKSCPVMIPYKSTLTHEEHRAYLRAFVRFRIRPAITPAEAAEHKQYLSLQHRVYNEQCEFNQFSYQVALAQLPAYNTVPETITAYLNNYVQHRSKRAVRYKQIYVHEQQVPICPQDPTKRFSNLSFTQIGHLLSLGTVPWFKIPNQHSLNKLPLDDSVARAQPPAPNESTEPNIIHKTPVSEDNNAAYLAQKHRANIVISTSALKVLVDNHGPSFDKEWVIPVVVKSFQVQDADGTESSHRVVFIDKPLPQKTWTPLEKKRLFYKKSALTYMSQIKPFPFLRMRTPKIFMYSAIINEEDNGGKDALYEEDMARKAGPCKEYDEDMFDLTSGATSDCFGDPGNNVPPPPSSPVITNKHTRKKKLKANSRSPKKFKKNCGQAESSPEKPGEEVKSEQSSPNKRFTETRKISISPVKTESFESTSVRAGTSDSKTGENVLENLLDMQDSLLKPSHSGSSASDSKFEYDHPSSSYKPWGRTLKTNWKDHTKPQSCEKGSGTNVHYQLFSLGFNNTQVSDSSQPLRVIVRHNLHGLSKMNPKKNVKAYIVFSKPENQAYFGSEVNTLSEITHQWISLLVRPNTTLLQVRVCESSGEILLSEEKDLATVVKDGKQAHIGFSPTPPLSILHSVFSATAALSTGNYLLHHRLNTAFILLMKAIDLITPTNLQTLDLHHYYSNASALTRPFTAPPWLAIDTHILTPFHLKHEKIPATFPMNNPNKTFTKEEKKRITEKAKKKKKIFDYDLPTDD